MSKYKQIKLEDGSGRFYSLESRLTPIKARERWTRSIKSSLFWLFLSICFVPVPGLHLILVPSFFLLAIYSGFTKLREVFKLDMIGLKCPSCHEDLNEKSLYFRGQELRIYCSSCRAQLTVREG